MIINVYNFCVANKMGNLLFDLVKKKLIFKSASVIDKKSTPLWNKDGVICLIIVLIKYLSFKIFEFPQYLRRSGNGTQKNKTTMQKNI